MEAILSLPPASGTKEIPIPAVWVPVEAGLAAPDAGGLTLAASETGEMWVPRTWAALSSSDLKMKLEAQCSEVPGEGEGPEGL
eukprot:CAMPEP_0184298702 /NCGR_PEP_ID=MMETSP1049-20130417/9458_1 /TAXON_ID=77928 /ORGANISM="Proteomonas sulcata, Strain CCMP704" /LENGTH=82 /DNA_ID=CAMNT_0026608909 /DNA_START=587 /DNA_END=833 /DNA_ORIENTATION=-